MVSRLMLLLKRGHLPIQYLLATLLSIVHAFLKVQLKVLLRKFVDVLSFFHTLDLDVCALLHVLKHRLLAGLRDR
jgi:hypothetical protein